MANRRVTLTTQNVNQIFRRLLDWLGEPEIERRLKVVRRELQTERGLYLQEWVKPKSRWWTALSEAIELHRKGLRFKGRIKTITWPFETGAHISALYTSMPAAKREDLRQRILHSVHIAPVLIEIEMAAHFWQMGFDLEWPESRTEGGRIPEFICKSPILTYEVECKTKTIDAGRMVTRPRFYRLVDLLVGRLRPLRLYGDVHIITPGRLPGDSKWQALVVDTVGNQGPGPSGELALEDGTSITTSLMAGEAVSIPKREIDSRIASVRKPFTHLVVQATQTSEVAYVNPLILRVESRKVDDFPKSVLRDLRDAKRQLSGGCAGIIVCFVPEVESFQDAATHSALDRVTLEFFDKHAPDSVYGVTFISDRQTEVVEKNLETLHPSLTFYNARYNQAWGPATKYMASSF